MAIYVSSIIDEVLEDLNESTTSPRHITRAKVLSLLNRCQRFLCQKEVVPADSYEAITLATGIDTYPINTDAHNIAYGIYDDEPVRIVTPDQLDGYNVAWRGDTGAPWYLLWELKQPHSITVYKTPTADEAGTVLYLQTFMADLLAMLDDDTATLGTLPFGLQNEFDAFYHYAIWKASSLRSDLTDTQMAAENKNMFLVRLRELQTKAPKRLTIVGRLGAGVGPVGRGPRLPSDYPRLAY